MIKKANKLYDSYERKCNELGLLVPNKDLWVSTEVKVHQKQTMPRYLKKALAEEINRSKELNKMTF
jgi:hypothetical protein